MSESSSFQRIHAAVLDGDLPALIAATGEVEGFPNAAVSLSIGHPLVYAIYHGPIELIRALLAMGADPNLPTDDGFPPLIAAIGCSRAQPGAPARKDVDEIIRLLLDAGADRNQRGLNDYTPLHMAVAEGDQLAVQRLLDAGADPDLRTRIDEYETPLEMAQRADLASIAAVLERRGAPVRRRLRSGLTLLWDVEGAGEPVRRQHRYRIRLRMWLHRGEPIRWTDPSGPLGTAVLEDEGTTLVTEVRIDRHALIAGLFYGMDGMRVGGTRKVEIAPQLAYGHDGVPGLVPSQALLVAEVSVLGTTTR